MHTIEELNKESDELLLGTSRATTHNEALMSIMGMPVCSHALEKLLQTHCQHPHQLVGSVFLLGVYMGLQYQNMKVFMEE